MSQFTDEFSDFLQHQVLVRTMQSAGAYGHKLADPRSVEGIMVMETSQVVQLSSGEYVQSNATIHADLPLYDAFNLDSVVHLPSGLEARVIKRDRLALGGFPSHLVVYTG